VSDHCLRTLWPQTRLVGTRAVPSQETAASGPPYGFGYVERLQGSRIKQTNAATAKPIVAGDHLGLGEKRMAMPSRCARSAKHSYTPRGRRAVSCDARPSKSLLLTSANRYAEATGRAGTTFGRESAFCPSANSVSTKPFTLSAETTRDEFQVP